MFKRNIVDKDFVFNSSETSLKVIISSNIIDYFLLEGRPLGFQLEILEDFCSDHYLNLDIIVENNIDIAIEKLIAGEADLFASSLYNCMKNEEITCSNSIYHSKSVLVQKKTSQTKKPILVQDVFQLNGKLIYLPLNSNRIVALDEFKEKHNLTIIKLDSLSDEFMLKCVYDSVFDYAVVDYGVANALRHCYSTVDYSNDLSFSRDISWVARSNSEVLLDSLNSWLSSYKQTQKYNLIVSKYFSNNYLNNKHNIEFNSLFCNCISVYDSLFKVHSLSSPFDWRLIASLAFEESRFTSDIVSAAGARGVMQIMPNILSKYSSSNYSGDEANIYAAIKYLSFIDSVLSVEISDVLCRTHCVLVAYNIGLSHVEDAIRLAKKYNRDVNLWEDMSLCLRTLSVYEYYTDLVVKNGFCQSKQSIDFSNNIMKRYKHYLNLISNNVN